MNDEKFCLWLAGKPPGVVAAIARSVGRDLAEHGKVEVFGLGGPADLEEAGSAARAGAMVVVVGPTALDDAARDELELEQVVEVWVGAGPPEGAAPAVVVRAEAATAGESASVVLRHLAAAGLTAPLDDYSDDDEAAVAGRLQNFGYL